MTDKTESAPASQRLKMGMMLSASFLVGLLTVVTLTHLRTTPTEAVIEKALAEADVSLLPDYCSSTSLTAGPSSDQLSCLSDVKKEFGTLDCQSPKGFEIRLKADVAHCEAKVMACFNDRPATQLDAVARKMPVRKSTMIVKREPAKLVQLGRAKPATQTRSYLIQCDTEPQNLN